MNRFWDLAAEYPVPVGIALGIVVFGLYRLVYWPKNRSLKPTKDGKLRGTARVLSFENTHRRPVSGLTTVAVDVVGAALGGSNYHNDDAEFYCRIELEVNIPR